MTGETIPEDRQYTTTHEWVRSENGELLVGITDYAQRQLTDVVYVDLPAVGKTAEKGASVLVLESVKTVTDIYAPTGGVVSAVNSELGAHPEWINQDPYGRGWIFRLRPTQPPNPSELLDAAAYRALTAQGA